jgi:hypothetical protein
MHEEIMYSYSYNKSVQECSSSTYFENLLSLVTMRVATCYWFTYCSIVNIIHKDIKVNTLITVITGDYNEFIIKIWSILYY